MTIFWSFVFATQATLLDYKTAVQKALAQSPALQQERASAEVLKSQAAQALAPHNPQLFYSKNNSTELSSSSRGASDELGVNIQIDFPGKSLLQSRSLEARAQAGIEKAHAVELQTILAVNQAFVDYRLGSQQLSALRRHEEQTQNLLKVIEQKYKMAQASQVDLFGIRAQNSDLALQVLAQQQENEKTLVEFRSLIREPNSQWEPNTEGFSQAPEVQQTAENLVAIAEKNNLSLKELRWQQKAADLALSRSRLQALPDFALSASIQVYNEPNAQPNPNVSRDYTLGVSMAVPLFFPFNESNQIQQARQESLAQKFAVEKKMLDERSEILRLFANWTMHQRLLKTLRTEVLPMHQANVDLTLRAYLSGKADYLRLKDARQSYLQGETRLWEAEDVVASTFLSLLSHVGCDFTRRSPVYACE